MECRHTVSVAERCIVMKDVRGTIAENNDRLLHEQLMAKELRIKGIPL